MNAILVDSNLMFTQSLVYQLRKVGVTCTAATSPALAVTQARLQAPSLIVVKASELSSDRQIDSICKIRREHSAPIVVLGNNSDPHHLSVAERMRVDDFAAYNGEIQHLMKRLRQAVWRLTMKRLATPPTLDLGEVVIDPDRFEARVCGRRVNLSVIEMEILYCLGLHASDYVSHETLSYCIWGAEASPKISDAIKSHVRSLRSKIELDSRCPKYIMTRRSVGYMLVVSCHEEETLRT